MALFLVQHGKSAPKSEDPEKGLTALGREETLRLAPVAKGYKIPVSQIFHSGKTRAARTAEIYDQALTPELPVETLSGIGPMDDVHLFAATLDPDAGWMVVGHMPFMERLVSLLTTGDETKRVYAFQNSGIVCLDAVKDDAGKWDWFIKWTLNPNIN